MKVMPHDHHWENKSAEALKKKPFLLHGISCFVTSFELFFQFSFYSCGRLALFSSPQRPVYGGWEERKRERAGRHGKGKREERLTHFPSSHRSRALSIFLLLLFLLDTQQKPIRRRVDT